MIFFFLIFFRSLFEHAEIFTRLALKVLVRKRQYKLHNKLLFGSSLLSFYENYPFSKSTVFNRLVSLRTNNKMAGLLTYPTLRLSNLQKFISDRDVEEGENIILMFIISVRE